MTTVHEPQAWTLSGDSYTPHPGDKPWIAEMYGYSYGAAKAGIAHEWLEDGLLYPGDPSAGAREPSTRLCCFIETSIK